jgi:HK97 gp10 family phage protein
MASEREVVKIIGLEGVMRTLQQLPAEVVSKGGGPVRSALAKSARMIRDDEQRRLQAIIDAPGADPAAAESTGLLKKNIVAKRGRLAGGEKGELYSVGVRRKSYPAAKGKRVTTPQVARLLEYGTEKRLPLPFIRPAFEANKGKVLSLFTAELNKKLGAITKKLARQNGVA